MKVKIIKSNHWHTGMVGQEFNVKYSGIDGRVEVTDKGFCIGNGLHKDDYEIVPESTTKLVTHEGISYLVPTWAACLTRDSVGNSVYHWEYEPQWFTGSGYSSPIGRRNIAQVYVAPKPDGHFIVAI